MDVLIDDDDPVTPRREGRAWRPGEGRRTGDVGVLRRHLTEGDFALRRLWTPYELAINTKPEKSTKKKLGQKQKLLDESKYDLIDWPCS